MRSNKGNRSIELVPNLERIMGRQSEITSIPVSNVTMRLRTALASTLGYVLIIYELKVGFTKRGGSRSGTRREA
jgi:hypothetical protein